MVCYYYYYYVDYNYSYENSMSSHEYSNVLYTTITTITLLVVRRYDRFALLSCVKYFAMATRYGCCVKTTNKKAKKDKWISLL